MTANHDLDRRLADHYAAVAPSNAPDWVLEGALANVHNTPQRRVLRRVPRRLNNMNTLTKLAMAAVVVIAVGALGIGILRPATGDTPAAPGPTTSPSPAPSVQPSASATASVAAERPVEFTGQIPCQPMLPFSTTETVRVGDDGTTVTRERGLVWEQSVSMSDPRLNGTLYFTLGADRYFTPGVESGPEVFGTTTRIVNEAGAWENRGYGGSWKADDSIGESSNPEVWIGQGGYEGLVAIVESTETTSATGDCAVDFHGIIFADPPVPEPYIAGQ